MYTVAVSGRLRCLASDFLTLQGLRQVAAGFILLLVHAAWDLNNAWAIWLLPAAVVLIGIASWRVGVYYERRFGHVELRTRPGFWGSGQPFFRRVLFWAPAMLVFVALPKFANVSPAGLLLGAVFVGLFVTENRPWYYLLFSLPFFIMAGVGNTSDDEIRLVSVQVWLIPLALIITGILDHLRLIQSFPGLRSNGAA